MDGRRAELGEPLTGDERVVIDGKPVTLSVPEAHSHLAYYKPSGELTTRDDPEQRPTIFEQIPPPPKGRWINVGRLDMNTSGLLLLTTDGELAHRLMHPRYEISREYAVRLLGTPTDQQWELLRTGVQLDDGPAHFDRVQASGGSGVNEWYHVTLKEGRNREVRRMFEALNLTISRLIRVRYGPVQLGKLPRARSRALEPGEVDALYAAVDLPNPASIDRAKSKSRPSSKASRTRASPKSSRSRAPSTGEHKPARSPRPAKASDFKASDSKTSGMKTSGSKTSSSARPSKTSSRPPRSSKPSKFRR